ncbi:MAG: FAD-dependent thymidylate synthase [Pelolinea sp.]|nr:FAD-dependent thymidylate synthase [Pelolinea sp.]
MNQPRRIYLLDPKKLSPETIAVTFAKTSRSSKSFDEIASELSDQQSADFNEKWVVGYGHSSVAEHAVLHIAVENISRLAVECLESNRLASYTEKSSRYQIWDEDHFFTPDEIKDTGVEEVYTDTCKSLFKDYLKAVNKITEYISKSMLREEGESDRAYSNRINACSADICRYYLPTCSLANVGVSINARSLEHALRKMLSHPLKEVQNIGQEIKTVSLENIPTLVKYADQNEYLTQIGNEISALLRNSINKSTLDHNWFNCMGFDEGGELQILAALLYRFSDLSFKEAFEQISQLPPEKLGLVTNSLLGNLGQHDIPVRELEYAHISFDLIIDQGAYFELKRHRMMAQTVKPFTPELGFAIPKVIEEVGLLDNFSFAMEKAKEVFLKVQKINPHAAPYILPNAYNRRVLIDMNLRTALHFLKLRTAPNAHFAIRRPAQRIAEEIRTKFPIFTEYFIFNGEETSQTLEDTFFLKTS